MWNNRNRFKMVVFIVHNEEHTEEIYSKSTFEYISKSASFLLVNSWLTESLWCFRFEIWGSSSVSVWTSGRVTDRCECRVLRWSFGVYSVQAPPPPHHSHTVYVAHTEQLGNLIHARNEPRSANSVVQSRGGRMGTTECGIHLNSLCCMGLVVYL